MVQVINNNNNMIEAHVGVLIAAAILGILVWGGDKQI